MAYPGHPTGRDFRRVLWMALLFVLVFTFEPTRFSGSPSHVSEQLAEGSGTVATERVMTFRDAVAGSPPAKR